eukprot:COSAG05_NODE_73_length_21807_cov_283.593698_7_plen_241_part_00
MKGGGPESTSSRRTCARCAHKAPTLVSVVAIGESLGYLRRSGTLRPPALFSRGGKSALARNARLGLVEGRVSRNYNLSSTYPTPLGACRASPTATNAPDRPRTSPRTRPEAWRRWKAGGRGRTCLLTPLQPRRPLAAPPRVARTKTAAVAVDRRPAPPRPLRQPSATPKRSASRPSRSFAPSPPSLPAFRPRRSRAQPAKRPTSHTTFDPALVRDAVRSRSEALERCLRTPPKRPTRAKE